ncbi:hypothetical protein CPC16_002247 [Podila verticillata]|nr:hypothetical protein BGZ52_005050 [Haplosporangium bisporale]KAF9393347.1 hypothetical protein CPC16_002247 [Podila verticillata]KAI9240838.1 MAG: hypothetical protein BYD32DRAFT_449214 [Podila humilis]
MTRFTSIVIACAIALVSVSAQDFTTPSCVINTPTYSPQVGKPYTVTFTGCSGDKPVKLRYGLPEDLKTASKVACNHVNMSSGSCTFTPTKAGDFAFSVEQDGAKEESYSAFFKVVPAPEAKGPIVPASKELHPVADMKPEVKKLAASPKELTVPAGKGPQPVADRKPKVDGLPASPKGPAVPAAEEAHPMTSEKPKVKMAPSSSKAEAARKANTKRALYDMASFAL